MVDTLNKKNSETMTLRLWAFKWMFFTVLSSFFPVEALYELEKTEIRPKDHRSYFSAQLGV